MVSHALSLLVSLTGLTGAMLRPQSKNTDGQLHVLKINLCASSTSETCGSQFPALFYPFPLKYIISIRIFLPLFLPSRKKLKLLLRQLPLLSSKQQNR